MTLIIGFSKPKGKFLPIFSWLIRKFENLEFSHVYLKITTSYGDLVYQASGNKVNFTNYKIFCENNTIVDSFEFAITEQQRRDLLKFCIDNVGVNYSTSQIMIIALNHFLKKLGYRIKYKNDVKGMICSEVAARILNLMSESKFENLDTIGVADVYYYLKGTDLG